jgi:uncharacterized membrane protein YphA (DoxX/SURF4 family)
MSQAGALWETFVLDLSHAGQTLSHGGNHYDGVGLASGDFATAWQHVRPNAPFRVPVAYLTASIELAAGLVLLWRRTARAGALTLTVVYSVFTLVRVPKALVDSLRDFDARSSLLRSFGTDVCSRRRERLGTFNCQTAGVALFLGSHHDRYAPFHSGRGQRRKT